MGYDELQALGAPRMVEVRFTGGIKKPWLVDLHDRNGEKIIGVARMSLHLDAEGTHPWATLDFGDGRVWRGWAVFFGSRIHPADEVPYA